MADTLRIAKLAKVATDTSRGHIPLARLSDLQEIDTEDRTQISLVYEDTDSLDFGEYPRCAKHPTDQSMGCLYTAADGHRCCVYCGEED